MNQISMFEHAPIVEFLEEFQGILDEASIIGLVILEEQKCVLLLGAYASWWKPFITWHGSNTNWTLSNLIGIVLEEATMKNYEDSKKLPVTFKTTFFLQDSWKLRNNSKFKNHNLTNEKSTYSNLLTCHYYGKPNHIRPNYKILAHDKANGVFKLPRKCHIKWKYQQWKFSYTKT